MRTIALIGCGRISTRHIQVLTQTPGLRLVAVCDVIEQRARTAAEPLGIPFYSDAMAMVERERPDIVAILTESGAHARLAIALAPHVSTLVVEKPMALTLEDADELIETCDRCATRLFVVKQNRFNPPVVKLRQALESGAFGKLVMGTVRVRWCRDQSYYDQAPWRGTWENDGGVFTNQASHHIDLLQWMMGPVESVQAYIATRLVDIESEDTGVAVLRFKNGALGVIEATTATRPKDLEGSISILGEKGSVVIGGFAVNKLETWNFTDPEVMAKAADDPSQVVPNVYGLGHKAFYQDVLDCLDTGRNSMLAGLEGRKSLEIINALYESAATGREVFLRFVPHSVQLGEGQVTETSVRFPNVQLGEGVTIDDFVILGRAPKGAGPGELALVIGAGSVLRSHSVIYAGSRIGARFQCGHGALVREQCSIGEDCSVGSGSALEFLVTLGDRVRIHSHCFVPEHSVLEDDCWIGPNVVLTNAKFPQTPRTKELLAGVRIGKRAKIGANSTILPGVAIGAGALVGAGSVVTRDVADGMVVMGNPARAVGRTADLRYADSQELVYPGE